MNLSNDVSIFYLLLVNVEKNQVECTDQYQL